MKINNSFILTAGIIICFLILSISSFSQEDTTTKDTSISDEDAEKILYDEKSISEKTDTTTDITEEKPIEVAKANTNIIEYNYLYLVPITDEMKKKIEKQNEDAEAADNEENKNEDGETSETETSENEIADNLNLQIELSKDEIEKNTKNYRLLLEKDLQGINFFNLNKKVKTVYEKDDLSISKTRAFFYNQENISKLDMTDIQEVKNDFVLINKRIILNDIKNFLNDKLLEAYLKEGVKCDGRIQIEYDLENKNLDINDVIQDEIYKDMLADTEFLSPKGHIWIQKIQPNLATAIVIDNKLKMEVIYQANMLENWIFKKKVIVKLPPRCLVKKVEGYAMFADQKSDLWVHLGVNDRFYPTKQKLSIPNEDSLIEFKYEKENIKIIGPTYIPDLMYFLLNKDKRAEILKIGRILKNEMILSAFINDPKPPTFMNKDEYSSEDLALTDDKEIRYENMIALYYRGEYKTIADAIDLINKRLQPYEVEVRLLIMKAGCLINMNKYIKAFETFNDMYGSGLDNAEKYEDRMLFYAGLALHLGKKYKTSNVAFKQLLDKKPKSKLVEKAYFYIGLNYKYIGEKYFARVNLNKIKLDRRYPNLAEWARYELSTLWNKK